MHAPSTLGEPSPLPPAREPISPSQDDHHTPSTWSPPMHPGRNTTHLVDLAEPESITRFGKDLDAFDHLISTVSMHAAGSLLDLTDQD